MVWCSHYSHQNQSKMVGMGNIYYWNIIGFNGQEARLKSKDFQNVV